MPIESFQCIVASPTSRVVRFPFTQSQKMTFEVRRETVYNHSWSSTCQLKIFTPFAGPVWKKHVKQGLCSKFLCNLSTFTEFWVESRQEYNDTSQKFRGTFKFTLRIQHNMLQVKSSAKILLIIWLNLYLTSNKLCVVAFNSPVSFLILCKWLSAPQCV